MFVYITMLQNGKKYITMYLIQSETRKLTSSVGRIYTLIRIDLFIAERK